ncbi:HEPN domain-containing protein [archaeon]|nr:HEPN domain-containing protein [archaeon]
MKGNKFLNKLKIKEKIELVDPNKDICNSYLEKSDDCLKSAEILFNNNLYENSVSMSYYSMYNSLMALLFSVGIKCENHSGAILLLKLLFKEQELFNLISDAKSERIDKQYYVITEKDELSKESTKELLRDAEDFILKIKVIIKKLNNELIKEIRKNFEILVNF